MGHDRHVPTARTGWIRSTTRRARLATCSRVSPGVFPRHDTVLEDRPVGLREFADLHRGEAL